MKKRFPLDSRNAGFSSASTSVSEQGRPESERVDGISVSFIDVGKGDCILIQVGEASALIDTGYANTSDETLAYLRERGVTRLEFVIITHYDRDHIGGMRNIGKALAIGVVYLPGYRGADKNYDTLMSAIRDLGLTTRSVTERLSLPFGDARFTLIPSGVAYVHNANGDEGNDNDLSLAASLERGGESYLFTGDLDEDGIASFLKGSHGTFDILKVPRHGQKSANTGELLEAVRPKIGVITDSREDPANKKVVKSLAAIGAQAYRTSVDGTIVVKGDGPGRYSVTLR